MPKFTLFISQQGRDFDDGGGRLEPLRAETLEAARIEAREYFRNDDDVIVDDMVILQIAMSEQVGIAALVREQEAEKAARVRARIESVERAELERLKTKFSREP